MDIRFHPGKSMLTFAYKFHSQVVYSIVKAAIVFCKLSIVIRFFGIWCNIGESLFWFLYLSFQIICIPVSGKPPHRAKVRMRQGGLQNYFWYLKILLTLLVKKSYFPLNYILILILSLTFLITDVFVFCL